MQQHLLSGYSPESPCLSLEVVKVNKLGVHLDENPSSESSLTQL